MAWTIKYADSALRQLDKPIAHRILDCLDERIATADDPRVAGKALTGPMGGLWRYRVGDYRIVCDVRDGELMILVIEAGNRKDIYWD